MKSILLCDANFCVLPIAEFIISQKYNLSVVGSLKDDPAHQIAHESILLDYSNVKLLREHVFNSNYNYIVPGCNDRSYLSLAKLAEEFHYPGFDDYETVLTIHHKDKFRSFAKKKGYPIPKFVDDIDVIDSLNFPIIIKPVDSFSGKGTKKTERIDEVKQNWNEAIGFSKEGLVIAEEFIEGNLYSHSAFIKNKKIIVDFFVSEYCTVYPYQVNSSNISNKLSENIQKKLKEWTEQFAQDLNLVDGLIHTQFISDNNTFSLIEVTRRCPGDLYSKLIQMSTGINYSELYTIPFIGLALPDSLEKKKKKLISRHTVSVDHECIFLSSKVLLKSEFIENVQLKTSGMRMKEAPFDKSGIYFIEFNSVNEVEEKTENLKKYILIEKMDILGS